MFTVRRSEERGRTELDWLESRHTFSFDQYYDPAAMGFSVLRVLNDDRIAAGAGFPTHPHRDMEIVTWVLSGALEHRDSLGNGSIIRPGEAQRMTSGRGVTHSEFNPSPEEALHLLQIWLLPARRGLEPGYEQRNFPEAERQGRLRLIVSPDGADGSITIHQDARIYAGLLDMGSSWEAEIGPARHVWLQVARGAARANGHRLDEGDGAALVEEGRISIEGIAPAELLLFDLP
ncbi:pirin family protein [Methylacidimicrobium tartarophylax]|uniref:Quercetin 2,3-dioxygenase n=1 Tax=Methylacidimicrobium tartarophylax TaxID=1041768 RepID=A0A5E6MG08_9BACT|nr:pirin family protein [Methylacidimicrobium tartarophylax]VVM08210.1 Quercetin 2,3-dioxygenase [Methylacidimicrobium tartarophylax]